ncbi:hypothetical protein [Pseudomonas soli]|uniref:hypothetical protein n=1 Tax=Pseudomonas soli TaxID=1306993 RepID=UPI0028B0BC5F|nr:hypothetical protein [Pseudomonas soli]
MDVIQVAKDLAGNPAVTALLGALVGGWFTRGATLKAHDLNKRSARIESLTDTKNALTLLQVELRSAWGIYEKEYAPELLGLEDGYPFLVSWPIGENTFVIYESMPECLTQIAPSVAGAVVQMYMRVKGLVAMIEENNRYSEMASAAGLQRLETVLEDSMANGVIMDVEMAAKHNEFLNAWTEFQAVKIGMGNHADTMKELTREISESLPLLFDGLNVEVKKIDNEVVRLSKE